MRQKYYLLFLILVVFHPVSYAQVEDEACLEPSKKVMKLLETAKAAPDAQTASTAFNAAIKENPDNALAYFEFARFAYENGDKFYEKGNISLGDRNYQTAKERYKETLEHCSDYHADCYFYIGVITYLQNEKEEALRWFKAFQNFKSSDPSRYSVDYSKQMDQAKVVIAKMEADLELMSKKVPFEPRKVMNVSSANDEYFPMISPDNELMFFTRKINTQAGSGEKVSNWVEHFSFSYRKDIATEFDKGTSFSAPFNGKEFQSYGAATMSVDNKEMIFCACKNEMQSSGQTYLNCDLYRTEFERSGKGGNDFTWSKPENMGPYINTSNGWEGQPTLSADGNTMYYTAMRPTTRDNDIFVVHRDKDGKWGQARPFDEINTVGKDKSPFLHQDSETLYFVSTCSETRRGAGGLDIFYIRKENGVWSKPKNIGIPINTIEDELGIFVSTNGELAYYSSRYGGNWEIYAFELYPEARPSAVTIMKGTLKDENGDPIKNASIEVAYDGTNEKSTVRVNGNDGKYAVVVKNPTQQDVMVTVKKDGYAFDSKLVTKEDFIAQAKVAPKDVTLPKTAVPKPNPVKAVSDGGVKISANAENTPVSMPKNDMVVKKLKVGIPYTINDILFETGSAELSSRSKFILKQFSEFLVENKTAKIMIQGHTDDVGEDQENLVLSENRAMAVKAYLESLKISSDRMTAKGFGETVPKVSNTSDANRAKNRRTDFVLEKL
jgi:outer membrane protein OmpA-like peptidoglycan-associated protein/tetratricopeptide (TPR) repeat protein